MDKNSAFTGKIILENIGYFSSIICST